MEGKDGHTEGKKLQDMNSLEMERKRSVTGVCLYIAVDTIALSFYALIDFSISFKL